MNFVYPFMLLNLLVYPVICEESQTDRDSGLTYTISSLQPLVVYHTEWNHTSTDIEKTTRIWEEKASTVIPGESSKVVALQMSGNSSVEEITPVMLIIIDEKNQSGFTVYNPQDLFNESIYFYSGQIDKLLVSKRTDNGIYVVVTASGGDWYDRWEAAIAMYLNKPDIKPEWLIAKYDYSQDDATCMGKKVDYFLDDDAKLSMIYTDVCTGRKIGVDEVNLPSLLNSRNQRLFDSVFQNCLLFGK